MFLSLIHSGPSPAAPKTGIPCAARYGAAPKPTTEFMNTARTWFSSTSFLAAIRAPEGELVVSASTNLML